MPAGKDKPQPKAKATTKTKAKTPRRPRKPPVSFDDPAPAAGAAAAPVDWVYRTGASKSPRRKAQPSAPTATPSAAPVTPGASASGWLTASVNALLMPVSLALVVLLAPLGRVSSPRKDR